MNPAHTPPSPGTALFGKLRTRADYVALAVDYPAAQSLRSWLEGGFEAAVERGLDPRLRQPWYFLVCCADEPLSAVGLLTDGQDRVGRRHPRWLCTPIATSLVMGTDGPLLPLACDPTLNELIAISAVLDSKPFAELPDALAAIAPPDSHSLRRIQDAQRHSLPEKEATLLTAATAAPGFALSAPGSTPQPRRLPIATAAGVFVWLELYRRVEGQQGHARSYFWSPAAGQLFVGDGLPQPNWFPRLLPQELAKSVRPTPLAPSDSQENVSTATVQNIFAEILRSVPDLSAGSTG